MNAMLLERRLGLVSAAGLWLLAAVACLSIAAQNLVWPGMAAYVALWFWGRRQAPRLGWVEWLWLAGTAWALAASLAALEPWHSLNTWTKLLLPSIAAYAGAAVVSRRQWSALLRALFFFSALWCAGASVAALLNPLKAMLAGQEGSAVLAHWAFENDWRARSGSGGYMVLATSSMTLLCLGAGLASRMPDWRRRGPVAAMVLIGLALGLTFTRGAWLGAAAGLALVALMTRPVWLAWGLAACIALSWMFPQSPPVRRLKSMTDVEVSDSNRERLYMARTGWAIVKDYPWFGVGDSLNHVVEAPRRPRIHALEPEGEDTLYQTYKPLDYLVWEGHKQIARKRQGHLHNNALQWAVMYGIPGAALLLSALLLLWASALRRVKQATEPWQQGMALGTAAALAAWTVNGFFEFNLGSVQSATLLWLVVGLYFASTKRLAPTGLFP